MGRDGTVASDRGLYTSAMGGSPVRPGVGELLGTFVLVYVGCAVAVAAALERPIAGAPYDSLTVALAFGVALLIVVAALGHITRSCQSSGDGWTGGRGEVPMAERAALSGRPARRRGAGWVRRLAQLRR